MIVHSNAGLARSDMSVLDLSPDAKVGLLLSGELCACCETVKCKHRFGKQGKRYVIKRQNMPGKGCIMIPESHKRCRASTRKVRRRGGMSNLRLGKPRNEKRRKETRYGV